MQDQLLRPEIVQHLHVLATELLQPAFNFKTETEASNGTTVSCEDETPKHTHVQHRQPELFGRSLYVLSWPKPRSKAYDHPEVQQA